MAFTARHADKLRYVAAWRRWLILTGDAWEFDSTLHVLAMVRDVCRAAAAGCESEYEARRIMAALTIAAVEKLEGVPEDPRADCLHR